MPNPVFVRFKSEIKRLRSIGAVFRASQALDAGISRKALYGMRDAGIIESLSRGLYKLSRSHPLVAPDLVSVARRVPRGVICLISALSYHNLTTQIPHQVHIAIERGNRRAPRIDYPPVRVYQFSQSAYSEGIEIHEIDKTQIKIYSIEKTLADAFKFRGKIGLDVFLEALKNWRKMRRKNLNALLYFAKINRVEKNMLPYLEALL